MIYRRLFRLAVVICLLIALFTSRNAIAWGISQVLISSVAGADIRDPSKILQDAFGTIPVQFSDGREEEVQIGQEDIPIQIQLIRPDYPANIIGPKILVYHTHTDEAYTRENNETYEETSVWRSYDNDYNIVRVGTELSNQLQKRGAQVWHATTNHAAPKLSTAYSRSIKTMQSAKDQENIKIFIDVHRDGSNVPKTRKNNQPAQAQIMFVVGTGEGKNGQTYDPKPDWKKNLAFAQRVTDLLNQVENGIAKQPMLRVDRYNQHMGLCLLIEVGDNQNTLTEVLSDIPLLSTCIMKALQETSNFSVTP